MEPQYSTRVHLFVKRPSHLRHPTGALGDWCRGWLARPPSGVVAVVLAAGAGTRFSGPGHKLDAVVADGRSVLDRAVGAALAAGIGPVVVVTAGQLRPPLHPAVVARRQRALGGGADHVAARRHRRGRRRSAADAVVVGLGDQPFISPEAWRAVAGVDAPIAVATYDGQRGHPVRLRRDTWDLLARHGDEGARSLLGRRPDLVD